MVKVKSVSQANKRQNGVKNYQRRVLLSHLQEEEHLNLTILEKMKNLLIMNNTK